MAEPGKTKHIAFVADNPGKWAVECLGKGRQTTPVVSWFEVNLTGRLLRAALSWHRD
jgi:hypothetical protein